MRNQFYNLFHEIDYEGFDYALRNYSSWQEIKDEEFHRLREAFVTAADELEAYIGQFECEVDEDEDY